MSTKTKKNEKSAPKNEKSAKAQKSAEVHDKSNTGADSAGRDALNGRIGARTHIMHEILCDAYKRGAVMTTSEIHNALNAQLAKIDRETTRAATASHLNTMRLREFVEHVNGRDWRLTKAGAELANVKAQKSAKRAK